MSVKISALPAVSSALLTDFFPVVQGGVTSQETLSQVSTLFQTIMLPLAGGTMSGNINLGTHSITNGTFAGTAVAGQYGGTGIANTGKTITIGGNVTFSGANTFAGTTTGNTAVTFPTSGTLATTAQLPTPAALTKVDDTNVTLTLGGTPATALLQATSITAGWTGTLSGTRGGTGTNNGSLTINLGSATTGYVLTSDSSGNATWQAGGGGSSPWTAGAGSNSAYGGAATGSAGSNSLVWGTTSSTASGDGGTIILGSGSTSSSNSYSSVLLGGTSHLSAAPQSIMLGNGLNNTSNNTINIGLNSTVSGAYSIAIGAGISITGTESVGIIYGTIAAGLAVGIGTAFSIASGHDGAFVFCDSTEISPNSKGANTYASYFAGGQFFQTGSAVTAFQIDASQNIINYKGICDLSKTIVAPTTGSTVTLVTTNAITIINPSGSLLALTINLPASPADGQKQTVAFTQIITGLTLSGNGNSLVGTSNLTSAAVGQKFTLIFDLGTTSWYPG